mmetsp:Transcript_14138/g.30338  ORF Transcript_14138/g.30338 Transcript_14138/m.30338 type:complete len:202 (+) Transcript_14138:349-954(+)
MLSTVALSCVYPALVPALLCGLRARLSEPRGLVGNPRGLSGERALSGGGGGLLAPLSSMRWDSLKSNTGSDGGGGGDGDGGSCEGDKVLAEAAGCFFVVSTCVEAIPFAMDTPPFSSPPPIPVAPPPQTTDADATAVLPARRSSILGRSMGIGACFWVVVFGDDGCCWCCCLVKELLAIRDLIFPPTLMAPLTVDEPPSPP